ncbi:SDR family NAD(P)-dependent oxidoreductase [Lichenifustis flavocetrariae]|uniref:SDR family NAD(P)-dependent oxidoreductase n=1 Tax=Lichenifustis flavocetrariae TaxID=2949735 RepID=A0AA41Z322_9HYPH|nr:SDR family NAD(P)-dependent oxidoreductase [Lichenifustis flavocetrariae]MCW6512819.1 SDR family NAD(P)-dependent oxidoreductase [Lichenifustis flavocetrariae]
MPHKQKHVLITGGGSGIGRALALEAASRDMAVALCGRRRDALDATAMLLGGTTKSLVIAADITRAADRLAIVDRLGERWGRLDVLVNNAGLVEGGPLEAMDDDALDRTFRTNVIGPMALTRDLLPLLTAAHPARIVNVGSLFGDIPYPGFTAYSASKFALRGFSGALRRECKSRGIGVTYAAPRATQTNAAVAFKELIAATKMQLDPPDRVAREIWDAVAKGADSVYASGPERLYVLIQRLFPRVIDRSLARQSSAAVPAPTPPLTSV